MAPSATPTSPSGAPTRTPTRATSAGAKPEEWERLGFNNSSVHTDIVSTTDRTVTAQLRGGEERVIYRDGEFQLD